MPRSFRLFFSTTLIFIGLLTSLRAQDSGISGVLLNAASDEPVKGALISVAGGSNSVNTAEDGSFTLDLSCEGTVEIVILWNRSQDRRIISCALSDLGEIYIAPVDDLDDQILSINMDQNDVDEIDQGNISSLLNSSNDIFASTAAFTFGPARFRIRGYDSDQTEMFLNGMPTNELDNGRVIWGQWGGLNDVMRLRTANQGLLVSDMAIGGPGGVISLDLRASSQRKQTRFTLSATNRNYRWRQMVTHSSGLKENGWAYTISGSRRYAAEGYVPGTWYDAFSYFVSVDKKFNDSHLLNAVFLGAPNRRGRQGPAQQELFDLAGTNYYNPWWGYQNGEKRNSRVGNYHQPIAMLRHDWTPSGKMSLTSTVSYQFGRSGSTALDWFNAQDPRPDYYRRLPSFIEDPVVAGRVEDVLRNDESARQIQWDALYEANLSSPDVFRNVDGIEGNDIAGNRSQYIISDRRFDSKEFNFNSVLNYALSDNISLQGGIQYRSLETDVYNAVVDLLGGDFYVDLDRFALTDFPDKPEAAQNDLNRPNRVVREGDRYGHDYLQVVNRSRVWAQLQWASRKLDIYAGASASQDQFWRDSKVRKGLFPDNSFGQSEKYSFTNYNLKAGATYKIDGRNYIHAGVYSGTRAPSIRDAFVSPRTRNSVVDGLVNETVRGGEISYNLKAPKLKIKALAYYTEVLDQIETRSFYHDDLRTFVNFSISDLDTRHQGIEFGVGYDFAPGWNIHAVAAVGEYFITSRPQGTFTQDNNAEELLQDQDRTIYAKNIRLSTGPQEAYNVGLTYRSPKFWSVFLNVNMFREMYTGYNPIRRTTTAVEGLTRDSEKFVEILDQEDLADQMTVDLSFSKSWRVNWLQDKRSFIAMSIGITNLLDNQDFITGGFEQLRFDFENQDVNTFPSRYYYYQGLNYFVNVNYRF